ncbi:MAG: hypothetical protein QM704_20510 [Anaeromyxobacteraceae bacterium]
MSARRDRLVFWALVALVVGAAGGAYVVLLGRAPGAPPPPRPAAARPPPEDVRIRVTEVQGAVEIERGGVRRPARLGDELVASDALVTAPGASVKIVSPTYEFKVEEIGRFGVEQATSESSRFRLDRGLVSARVDEDPSRAVEIASARSAVARTTGGELQVSSSGHVVAVAVRRGAARFTSGGQSVEVAAGQRTAASAEGTPSAPTAIPADVLLEVAWPEERITNRRKIPVSGRTVPGGVVVIGGATMEVQPDGRFKGTVELKEGEQRLVARARAAGVYAEARGPPVVLDTRAPDARFDTGGLWDKDPR